MNDIAFDMTLGAVLSFTDLTEIDFENKETMKVFMKQILDTLEDLDIATDFGNVTLSTVFNPVFLEIDEH